jgi:hypothetical protein
MPLLQRNKSKKGKSFMQPTRPSQEEDVEMVDEPLASNRSRRAHRSSNDVAVASSANFGHPNMLAAK